MDVGSHWYSPASLNSGTFAKELAYFSGAQSVTVTLEAVILDDGTALGPDANNTIPRAQARVDAERLVLAGIAEAWKQGGPTGMSSYVKGLVSSAPPPHGSLAVHSASPASAYSEALSDMETLYAKQFLRSAATNPAVLANFAQQALAKPPLNIHR